MHFPSKALIGSKFLAVKPVKAVIIQRLLWDSLYITGFPITWECIQPLTVSANKSEQKSPVHPLWLSYYNSLSDFFFFPCGKKNEVKPNHSHATFAGTMLQTSEQA